MAVVNHVKKWLYLMEPHTASRATSELLMKQCQGAQIGHHHIDIPELTDRRRQHIDPKKLVDYDIICTVRNPFDVLVTKWRFSGKGGMMRKRAETIARHKGISVEEVLDGPLNQPQPFHEWVMSNVAHPNLNNPSRGMPHRATHIVYYEHLNEDISTTFGRPLEVPQIANQKTEGKEPWASYYEEHPDLVDYLVQHWRGYLEKFGYRLTETYDGLSMEIDPEVRSMRTRSVRYL